MATGIQLPQYCEDLIYTSTLDRYLINDLGIQGGVVTTNSFKITAGSGLQVEASDGGAFIPGGEGGTTGMYHVSSLSTTSPYNNVEVSTSNPQIAQIILRIYDVNELKIGGSSFARFEWLNGTPNAGATKAHIEEGKASEFGAAAVPVSSYRMCYVVVPKNATVSSEYTIIDKRTTSQPIRQSKSANTSPTFQSWGNISATGTILGGSGDFLANKFGTGIYAISWDTAKASANYAFNVTPYVSSGSNHPIAWTSTLETNTIEIKIYDVTIASFINNPFSFIACATS